MTEVHHRTCCLCDALCRVRIEHEAGRVLRLEGDRDDPFSQGHVCAKALALVDVQDDPDRLRRPLRRRGSDWEEIGWEEAVAEAIDRLATVRRRHGRDSVGLYLGNPNAHHVTNLLALAVLIPTLGTRARFSSVSLDNLPHLVALQQMMGHGLLGAVPDVDRTDLLVVIGANPWVSNGGGMASGDVRRRIEGVRARGGRVVVLDPRRTETAAAADHYVPLRPAGDAPLLLALVHVLFAEGLVDTGRWRAWTDGVEELAEIAASWPPERVEGRTGVPAEEVRALARALAEAPRAVVYARLGACTQEFGGLTAWLVVVVNTLTGNLDAPGGLMIPRPAADVLGVTGWVDASLRPGATRGRGLPSFAGELPVAALVDEIVTPGPGQVRGMLTVAANPVLTAPDGAAVADALGRLDAHVAVDLYLHETTRHAHLVLPGRPPLERVHYPLGLATIAVRSVASWSEPLVPPEGPDDGELMLAIARGLARRERRWGLAAAGALMSAVGPRRLVDALLRLGPFGVGRGGLTVERLRASPHTVDLGPMRPCLPARLRTSDRRLRLVPAPMRDDLARLEAALGSPTPALVLIGRRDPRSANSWLHNSPRLAKGRERCVLHMHPADADARGVGDRAVVQSAAGAVEVAVERRDELMPGVVSLPHGWGHHGGGQSVAGERPGVNVNLLTDRRVVDLLTGTAVLQGVPVEVRPAAGSAPARVGDGPA